MFAEIQAVNSVFVSATLPVALNVSNTYLNQVYMGLFRPDANVSPRWYGNLKEYKLAYDSEQPEPHAGRPQRQRCRQRQDRLHRADGV